MMNSKGFISKRSCPNFKVLSEHSSGETVEKLNKTSVRIADL